MSSKAVVFAYHDIGCAGIEALLAGWDAVIEIHGRYQDPETPDV